MKLAPGASLGVYEIHSRLGVGGRGEVDRAYDPKLQRTVAIKVLAKQDDEASARLLQEARAASALNHPNICTIHEVGEAVPSLPSADQRQEQPARGGETAVAFIVMEYVEGRSLNRLIPAEGLPAETVIRYGTHIADALAHAHERGIVHRDLKSANVVITPEGRAKVLDFVSDASITRPATESTRAITRSYLVAGVAMVAMLALGLGYLLSDRADSLSGRPVPLGSPRQVTTAIDMEDYPTLSPDGQLVAYQRGENGSRDIWVSQIGEGQPANRTADHAGDDLHPSWSPDGRRIAFWSDRDGGGIYVMPVLSGAPRRVVATKPRESNRPQWSPDGTEIAIYRRDDGGVAFIEIVSLTDGASRRVPMPGTQATERNDMSWSPDGRFIAYQDGAHGWDVNGIWLVRVEDGEAFALTDGRTNDLGPTWSADSRSVYYVSNRGGSRDLWRQSIDDEGRPSGWAEPVTAGVGMSHVQMSSDGTRLAYVKGGRVANVWRVPILPDRMATWADAEQITFDTAFIEAFGPSPDGQRLAVSSDRAGDMDLWVLPAGGGELRQVTNDPSPDW